MAKRTGAGPLIELVAFDERVSVPDGYGNQQEGFAEAFQCRAGFIPLRGGETVIASRLEGRQPVLVRIRQSSQSQRVRSDWRMRDLHKGIPYAIRTIVPTPDRAYFDLIVEQRVAA